MRRPFPLSFFTFCIYLAFSSTYVFSQALPADIQSEIERRVSEMINPAVSVAVLDSNGQTYFYNFGKTDPSGSNTPSHRTVYEIGSVTKTFTAFLTQKHFNSLLQDSLIKYIPELGRYDTQVSKITINSLINHSSGLPRLSPYFNPEDWSDPFSGYSDQKAISELQKVQPATNGNWAYSNFGYALLGTALETHTSKDFTSLFSSFLGDAGMTNTYTSHELVPADQLAVPTNIGVPNTYWNFDGPAAYAGGLLSTSEDLISYLRYQIDHNPIFQSEVVGEVIPTGIDDLGKDQLFYKDGWFVLRPDPETEILLHNGGTGGFTSFLAYNKSTQTGVAILSNSQSLMDDTGLRLLHPSFDLNSPQRTVAYEIGELIQSGSNEDLLSAYVELKESGMLTNIIQIYWLERFHFGNQNFEVSDQLADIMLLELPEDWEVQDIKGQNLEGLGEIKKALGYYSKALELNPDNQALKDKINRLSE